MTTRPAAARGWVLALTAAGSLMVALDQLVVATALTTIRHDLHASLATLEWTVNAYGLSFAVLLIAGAACGDRYGRRRVFLAGLALFTLSSAACALAPDTGLLIAARAVQGAGAALVTPTAMALLTTAYPGKARGPALGVYSAITGLAVVGGPVIGGAITEGIAWQWIFWLNVPLGVVVFVLARLRIDEGRGTRTAFDGRGLALSGAGILGLVWGLVRANTAGWATPETVVTLAAGAVLLVAFVAWELRAPRPMMPMRYFRRRGYAAGNTATLLLNGSVISAVFFFAQYLQTALGYGPLAAGLRFVPWTAMPFLVAPLAGMLIGRIGARPLIVTGMALQGLGLGWVALNAADGRPYTASIVALVVAGVGVSLALPAVQAAVMGAVPSSALGTAAGTFNTLRQVGGVFAIAVLSAVFAANGGYRSPHSYTDGFVPALAVAAAMAAAGALAALAVPGRGEPTTTPSMDGAPEMEVSGIAH